MADDGDSNSAFDAMYRSGKMARRSSRTLIAIRRRGECWMLPENPNQVRNIRVPRH